MEKTIARLRPWIFTVAAMAALPFFAGVAVAAEPIKTVLDGHELAFDPPPVIEQDRTLVPMRGLLEALGATVDWEPASRTVIARLGDKEITAVIGSLEATVGGQPVKLDVAPAIKNDRTFVPIRFFVESLGMRVAWDEPSRTITVESRGATLPSRDGGSYSRRAATAALLAKQQIGAAYAWGGTSPETGFDCSGLVAYVARQLEMEVPRTSHDLFEVGLEVAQADLMPGDLVFFTTYAPGASHVGIYVGEGQFVHSESPERGVKQTPLSNPYWTERYLGARRLFR